MYRRVQLWQRPRTLRSQGKERTRNRDTVQHFTSQVLRRIPAVGIATLIRWCLVLCNSSGDTFSPIPFTRGEEISLFLDARRKQDPVGSALSLESISVVSASVTLPNDKNSRKSTFRFIGFGRNSHYLLNCFVDFWRQKLRNVALVHYWNISGCRKPRWTTHAASVILLLFFFFFSWFTKRQVVVPLAKSVDILKYVWYFSYKKLGFFKVLLDLLVSNIHWAALILKNSE